MRYLFALLLLLCVGCDQNAATDDYRPLGAAAIGVGSTADGQVTPVPAGNTCPNCNGTGKVGDGTIFVKCVPCDGTGKTK